jgi:DHA1 family multidrug resistance protein-like MFS transporter
MFFVQEDFTPVEPAGSGSFFDAYRQLIAAPGMTGLYGLTMLRSLGATLLAPILALFVLNLNNGVERGTASMTGIAIGVAAFTSAISAVYLGKLGDRIGHSRILVGSALAAALMYVPQIFVTSAWQLVAVQALAGIATGGMVPATAALMNLWAPGGRQGATYGLENSAQSAARTVAPMMSAAIAAVAGYRGVFAVNAFIYVLIAALALWVVRAANERHAVGMEFSQVSSD